MSYAILKQDVYQTPIDGLFTVKVLIDDNNVSSEDEDYLDIIGDEFVLDFIKYKIITIMQDIPTGDYFALCKILLDPEDYNIATVG